MRVAVTGSHGFMGKLICEKLQTQGCVVLRVVRDLSNLTPCDAIIHLGGESIATGRWTREKKRRILDSRVAPLRRIISVTREWKLPPQTILSASAIGFFGDRGDEILTETSSRGAGFLSDVCNQWEDALFAPILPGVRRAALRFGMVLGSGGALVQIRRVFRLGLGGPLGSGRQWMSWIHEDDAIRAILFVLNSERASGPINIVSPEPVLNQIFAKTLGRVLRRPTLLKAPALALRLILGEKSRLILDSQRVRPAALQELGFSFRFPQLRAALEDVLG